MTEAQNGLITSKELGMAVADRLRQSEKRSETPGSEATPKHQAPMRRMLQPPSTVQRAEVNQSKAAVPTLEGQPQHGQKDVSASLAPANTEAHSVTQEHTRAKEPFTRERLDKERATRNLPPATDKQWSTYSFWGPWWLQWPEELEEALGNERRELEVYETREKRRDGTYKQLENDLFIPKREQPNYSPRRHYAKIIVERAEQLGKDPLALTAEERKELLFQGRILPAEERQKHAEWERKSRQSIDKERATQHHRPVTDDMWNETMVAQMNWREDQERLQTRERLDKERATQHLPALTDEQWREWTEKQWLEEYQARSAEFGFRSTPEEMQEWFNAYLSHNKARLAQVSAFDQLPPGVKSGLLKQWYETYDLPDGKRLEQMTFWEVIGELIISLLASAANFRKETPTDKK
jgi:hypothetical protein